MIALPIIALLVFLALCVFVAEREAQEDYKLIVANKPVAHTFMEWIERATPIAIGFLVVQFFWLMIAESWEPLHWTLVLWIPMAWAAFTMSFRWFLNRKRGLDWRYISPSNKYDWFIIIFPSYLRGVVRFTFKGMMTRKIFQWHHDSRFGEYPAYRTFLYRKGLHAYILETSVLAVAGILFIINTN